MGQPGPGVTGLRWIIKQDNLARLAAAAPDVGGQLLAAPQLIVVRGQSGEPVPTGAVAAELYKSYADFSEQVSAGAVPVGTRAVIYDPESWAATPPEEKHDPMRYLALFAVLARGSGYQPILAPGRDLTLTPGGKCAKRPAERVGEAYVRCGIPRAAKHAAIFVIQAAPQELDLPGLHRLVEASSRLARAANPAAAIIATISTAPGGVQAAPAAMAGAAAVMLPFVHGFMLNMTAATTPSAVAFLRALPTPTS